MSVKRMGEILLPICDVLAKAHFAGVVHRDIKPPNIFLHHGPAGEIVKVLDFGIAKLVGDAAGSEYMTMTLEGDLLGTPAYMAPERLSNRPYDGRADVYGVGVMAYQMLTGVLPFSGAGSDRDRDAAHECHAAAAARAAAELAGVGRLPGHEGDGEGPARAPDGGRTWPAASRCGVGCWSTAQGRPAPACVGGGAPDSGAQSGTAARQTKASGLMFRQEQSHFFEQAGEVDRLGVVVVAPRCQRLFTVARHGVRGERDHWNARVSGACLMRRAASHPSITGRLMSMRMRSGDSVCAISTPCCPSPAMMT